jgi:AbiV family abortive infection protein
MKKKDRDYELNSEFLESYQKAAIDNAASILDEAKLLLSNNHYARAYFLAVASIEEIGKAFIAFSSKGRNLNNAALHKKLKEMFENHSQKISSAFVGWLIESKDQKEALEAMIDLMIHLKRGREKSMYVDARNDNTVTIPSQLVRPIAAKHSIEIAQNCLHFTKKFLLETKPYKTSSFDDKLLCIKNEKIQALFRENDFGKYLLHRLKTDGQKFNISEYIVTYHDSYYCKGKKFGDQIS